jgi:hypothetical protein
MSCSPRRARVFRESETRGAIGHAKCALYRYCKIRPGKDFSGKARSARGDATTTEAGDKEILPTG